MSLAALIRNMATAGASPEAIALAVEAIEAELNKAAEKRAQAAARKRAQRERDSHATVTGQSQDVGVTGSLDKGFPPDPPSQTQTSSAPLTPRSEGKKRSFKIPADWTPPPIAELSERAMEFASKWPAGRYEAEAEAFVAFWINDGRSRPDWRLTWITRVISVHGQVMRDARFAPGPPKFSDKPWTAAELRRGIASAEDNNDPDRAADYKRRLTELEGSARAPPDRRRGGVVSIGQAVQRVSHA